MESQWAPLDPLGIHWLSGFALIYKSQIVGAVDCFLMNIRGSSLWWLGHVCSWWWASTFTVLGYLQVLAHHQWHIKRIEPSFCWIYVPATMGNFFVSGRALEPVHFLAQFGNVKNKLAMVKKGRKKIFDVLAMPIYTDYFSKMGFPYYILLPPTTAYYVHLQTGPRPSLRLLWAV